MLKECNSCKFQISPNAKRCAKCGQPQMPESQKAVITIFIIALIVYAISKQF